MTVNVTPEMIQRFEAERKAKLAKTQADNDAYNSFMQQEKAKEAAYWAQRQANLKEASPKTDQTCPLCNSTIPAFTRAKYATKKTVYGSNFGWKRVYYCNKCGPLTEVKA